MSCVSLLLFLKIASDVPFALQTHIASLIEGPEPDFEAWSTHYGVEEQSGLLWGPGHLDPPRRTPSPPKSALNATDSVLTRFTAVLIVVALNTKR